MKLFQNKRIWQKIVIILLLLLLFQFLINKPVHAKEATLLEPVTSLFANLGDGIMEIMQKTFCNVDSSGAWVETDSNIWAKILTIAIGIAIAVTIIAASVLTAGAASFAIVAATAGAVIKVAGGTLVAYFAVDTLKFGGSGFYLPEYELTLQAIFEGKVTAFDVNFFDPKLPKENENDSKDRRT